MSETVPEGRDEEVEVLAEIDPDPETQPDALGTDELRPESEQLEYEPPNAPPPATASMGTVADEGHQETIDERLAQEEPDDQR